MPKKWTPKFVLALSLVLFHVPNIYVPCRAAVSDMDLVRAQKMIEKEDVGPGAIKELDRLLKANPEDWRLHFLLGRLYEKLGMDNMAAEEDRYIEEKGGDKFRQFVLQMFRDKIRIADVAGAETIFKYVYKYYPNDPHVLLVGAQKLQKQGRLAEAEQSLQKIVDSGDKSPGIWTSMGGLALERHNYQQGLEYFDNELRNHPDYRPAKIGQMKALELLGRYHEAIKTAEKFFGDDPSSIGIADTYANCLMKLGRYRESLEPALIAMSVAIRPDQMEAAKKRVINLYRLYDQKDREFALKLTKEILKPTGFLARFHFALGDVFDRLRMPDQAIIEYVEGLKLEPNHSRTFFRIGQDLENYYGRHRAALTYYLYAAKTSELDRDLKYPAKRLAGRLLNRKRDLAWRLKEAIPIRPTPPDLAKEM